MEKNLLNRTRGMALLTVLCVTALLALIVTGAFRVLMQRELNSSGSAELHFAQHYLNNITGQVAGKFNEMVQSKFADGTSFDSSSLQSLRQILPPDGIFQVDDLAYDCSIVLSLPNGSFTPSTNSAPLVTVTNKGHPLEGLIARRYCIRMTAQLIPKYSVMTGFTNQTLSTSRDLSYYDVPISSFALGASTSVTLDSSHPLVVTGATCYAESLHANARSLNMVGQILGAGRFTSSQAFSFNGSSFQLSDTATDWRYQTEVVGQKVISSMNPVNLGFDFSRVNSDQVFETGTISDTPTDRARKMYYNTDYRIQASVQGAVLTSFTVRDHSDLLISNAFTASLRAGFSVYTNHGPSIVVWNISSAPKTFNSIFFEINNSSGNRSDVGLGLDSCKDLSGFVNSSTTGLSIITPNVIVQLDHFNTTNSVPAFIATPEFYRGIP